MPSRSLPNNPKNWAFAGLLDRAQLPIVAAYDVATPLHKYRALQSASWDIADGVNKSSGVFHKPRPLLGARSNARRERWTGLLAKAPSEMRDGASAAQ